MRNANLKYVRPKRLVRLVPAIIIVLLAGAVSLGILSAQEMKRLINEDFNAQQLSLARHTASILEQNFKILKNELLTLALSPSIQYVESVSWHNRMKISLSSVREYGVFRIVLIGPDGRRRYSFDENQAVYASQSDNEPPGYFQWSRDPQHLNLVYISAVEAGVVGNSEPGLRMILATPVYQISPDEAHPVPTQKFAGVLAFHLDAGQLARKFASPIRSGKTGYAWVIDDKGKFLYHLEERFVGQNAFEARKAEDPHISFAKINMLQQEKMLQGKEGTSWYISGWHRGQTGRMKKLIAFAPVFIGAANAEQTWSVAVVAPVAEVQGAVQMVYTRQAAIQLVFGMILLVLLFLLRSNERMWTRTLEREVEYKTRDLESYARRLKDSEARYRSLVESADDLICALDAGGRIQAMNRSWTRMTDQPVDEAVGKSIWEIIEFNDPERVRDAVSRVLETDRPVAREEMARIGDRLYDLDTKYTKVTGTDPPDAPTVLVIARDITEHKRIEGQLFNAQKLASLGELSAGVAHEINNPIAIILGFTEMLLEKTEAGSKEEKILKAIERQGNNCKRIVENLLAFARIPGQEAATADLASSLRKVVDVVRNTLLTEKVDLDVELPDGLPEVTGSSQELEQVFLNIINNAVAAMEGGGLLRITAGRKGDFIRVDFRDTGPGIPAEIRDKIFEPFFTTKKVGEGTGLGLSVSYGIVKKFGGEIRVESRTDHQTGDTGATFSVLLPIAPVETAAEAPAVTA